eukprot:TRINITY_DN31478_c0_g1_i1.p1 TRINITY_DN31478_c0_g1~~TRINITY_DN31478_c0_g1_i1.p1  ORF type:complete len:118 (+),score=17.43 TRINITY_DN31478_c0_g1_i1:185-538(+)
MCIRDRDNTTPGISATAPTFFHNTAQFRRPLQPERITEMKRPPQTGRHHDYRRVSCMQAMFNPPIEEPPMGPRGPRVNAVQTALWDNSKGLMGRGVHDVGKFPFTSRPADHFNPQTF